MENTLISGIDLSTLLKILEGFRTGYEQLYPIVTLTEYSISVFNGESSTSYLYLQQLHHLVGKCLLFVNCYDFKDSYDVIQYLSPLGVLCIIDPSENEPIHNWIGNDYSGYRLVHQITTYSDYPDDSDPRIVWMSRKDYPIKEVILPSKIYKHSEPPNNCNFM